MRRLVASLALVPALAAAQPSSPALRVAEDARAIRRVAEASRRDFPSAVVGRIIEEDLELLRGRRSDGTYDYASFQREEAARSSDRYSLSATPEGEPDSFEVTGETVYQMIVAVPSRRLLVARNRPAWIERIELDFTPFGRARQSSSVNVRKWIGVGESTTIDLPEIAKRMRAKVIGRVDEAEGGPATVEVTLIQAKLVDRRDSPHYGAVQTLTSLARSADKGDVAAVKTQSGELLNRLGDAVVVDMPRSVGQPPHRSATETRIRSDEELEAPPTVELYLELQAIEDLLTGTEGERREGLDKLHQLVRKLRPSSANSSER